MCLWDMHDEFWSSYHVGQVLYGDIHKYWDFYTLGSVSLSFAHQSGVLVMWLCWIFAGLGAPLIVPPIRNALNRPEPIAPPKLSEVLSLALKIPFRIYSWRHAKTYRSSLHLTYEWHAYLKSLPKCPKCNSWLSSNFWFSRYLVRDTF